MTRPGAVEPDVEPDDEDPADPDGPDELIVALPSRPDARCSPSFLLPSRVGNSRVGKLRPLSLPVTVPVPRMVGTPFSTVRTVPPVGATTPWRVVIGAEKTREAAPGLATSAERGVFLLRRREVLAT